MSKGNYAQRGEGGAKFLCVIKKRICPINTFLCAANAAHSKAKIQCGKKNNIQAQQTKWDAKNKTAACFVGHFTGS